MNSYKQFPKCKIVTNCYQLVLIDPIYTIAQFHHSFRIIVRQRWVTSRKFCLLKLWLMMTSGMTSPAWRPCWTAWTMCKSSAFHIYKSVVDNNSCIVLLIMWSQSPLPLVVTTFSHLHNLAQFYSIAKDCCGFKSAKRILIAMHFNCKCFNFRPF